MGMNMGMNMASGLSGMLKEGHQSFAGIDEATLKNITAGTELADIVKSSLGPNGMSKLVVNHQEKITVTTDGATIVRELEVMHPAAKMIVLATEMQEKECGDGTSFVVAFAGELLKQSAELLRQGLHTAEVLEGYKRAHEKALEVLPTLVCHTVTDPRDQKQLEYAIRPTIASKQLGFEDVLAKFVAEAAISVMPPAPRRLSFNVDNIRVCKLPGGSAGQSHVIRGMVVQRDSETSIKRVENAKVAVFGCGIESSQTEAKGTVLIRTADELMNYNKSEEKLMEEMIKGIAEAGTKVIISQGTISDMALHFIGKYEMMAIKIMSKWELRRLCTAMRCTALVRLGAPTPEEMGQCDLVEVQEVGLKKVTVFQQKDEGSRLATLILRASTQSLLNDLERTVDDAIRAVKALCSNPEFVPGAGAAEYEIARQVAELGKAETGLDQYAFKKYAESLEIVPRILAETAGHDATQAMAKLQAAHAEGKAGYGIDVEGGSGVVSDMAARGVLDLLSTKKSAMRLAFDAAVTILRVDQIIMSRPAGGPKPR